jgi:hypothetical protein
MDLPSAALRGGDKLPLWAPGAAPLRSRKGRFLSYLASASDRPPDVVTVPLRAQLVNQFTA